MEEKRKEFCDGRKEKGKPREFARKGPIYFEKMFPISIFVLLLTTKVSLCFLF
jgi:hypothetical protein